jgi:hypothetical protein
LADRDLAGDRAQVPELWVDTLAARRLKVAVDYLADIRDLMAAGTQYYAPFALLRATLESSAAAVWLLEPDQRKGLSADLRAITEPDDPAPHTMKSYDPAKFATKRA